MNAYRYFHVMCLCIKHKIYDDMSLIYHHKRKMSNVIMMAASTWIRLAIIRRDWSLSMDESKYGLIWSLADQSTPNISGDCLGSYVFILGSRLFSIFFKGSGSIISLSLVVCGFVRYFRFPRLTFSRPVVLEWFPIIPLCVCFPSVCNFMLMVFIEQTIWPGSPPISSCSMLFVRSSYMFAQCGSWVHWPNHLVAWWPFSALVSHSSLWRVSLAHRPSQQNKGKPPDDCLV